MTPANKSTLGAIIALAVLGVGIVVWAGWQS